MGSVTAMTWDLVVVGGGAAGMMAAGRAAELGARVLLLEKTLSLGNKLRISGKGRCNLTNAVDIREFPQYYPSGGKFLQGALHRFTNWDLVDFFENLGVRTKIERGGRIFPESDQAQAVVEALVAYMHRHGVEIRCRSKVERLSVGPSRDGAGFDIKGVQLADGQQVAARNVLVATGGMSYPGTGSTGDGYKWAGQVGHTVSELFPSLVPLKVAETWVSELMGLSLRNVMATVVVDGVPAASEFGEMSFTHFGVSGPIILTLSRAVAAAVRHRQSVKLLINLKPALDAQQLDQRLQRDFEKYSRKQFKNSLQDLLPKRLIDPIISLSAIAPEKAVNQISRKERHQLAEVLRGLQLTITGTLPMAAAIVTAGGVALDEVNPRTMESKLVRGLFFAGEVLDIDGVTGGYNLQAAFSTGRVAAESIN